MRTKYIFLTVLSLAMGWVTVAQEPPCISGYIRNYTGVLTTEGNDFSIVKNTLNLNLEKRLGWVAIMGSPCFYHYFAGSWNWD